MSVLFRMERDVGLYVSIVQTFSSVLQQLPRLEGVGRGGGAGLTGRISLCEEYRNQCMIYS